MLRNWAYYLIFKQLKLMTYTEQYNQYVQEWIKENPTFSFPYEYMLDFDEWVDVQLKEFKKEKGL